MLDFRGEQGRPFYDPSKLVLDHTKKTSLKPRLWQIHRRSKVASSFEKHPDFEDTSRGTMSSTNGESAPISTTLP
ncbi:hypothetical protein SS1G_00765 [Sclerotinia sclerotiorum 1980 UF-70]|uniref:Uncharacterized protein n=2 Tax=Sclerotinia sclerotiorum (strain ATCC 18683 / 1980 / Ss-1) TaxID=665079 RepID=A7E640_SCLS1|nr:hypothetical protein SS1G_00765 [Sclerotinia sclerotiorum 1980 UF-70]APA07684.1 hypothetical protein sscle_03g024540 [Sclerotinia sclerotiorum 1980 UF-70]EDN91362.1 hypothetical protein SS1G_00765 [Sclerotinia sclerotiorum 1980 UF-70]